MDKLKEAQDDTMEQYRDGLITYREAMEQIERARKHIEIIKERNQ